MRMKKILILFAILGSLSCSKKMDNYTVTSDNPDIYPDYVDVVIPPNVAPLNFHINNAGTEFRVAFYALNDKGFVLEQSSPDIVIPERSWRKLIGSNRGKNLFIEIGVKNKVWTKFKTIQDSIVSEEVEPYLAYRLINSANYMWNEMGIYQRNIENYSETPLFRNRSSDLGCVNCHQFNQADPERMSLHFRKSFPGTVLLLGDSLVRLDTKTPYTMSAFSFPAWYPDGNYLACCVNLVHQVFTSTVDYHHVVYDDASDLIIYDIRQNRVTTSPRVSTQNRENMPSFSPDGKWLYYISCPPQTNDSNRTFAKYDLVRIPLDIKTNTWGAVDTLITSRETGHSITFPKVSPDGRYVMFTMGSYGYFTIFDKRADLYLFDIKERKYRKLESNSAYTDSYHTWSQTGRWFVFTSRRMENLYSRIFYSYLDEKGRAHKPFVLPQKDPLYYKELMQHYNLPELIRDKVKVDEMTLRNFIQKDPVQVRFDTTIDIDALSGATFLEKNENNGNKKL
jgi:hypothetical protein